MSQHPDVALVEAESFAEQAIHLRLYGDLDAMWRIYSQDIGDPDEVREIVYTS